MLSAGETIQSQAQRYVCLCQRHANMSMTANASKVLLKSKPELTSMSDETITEKLDYVDCIRPNKCKLWIKKDVPVIESLKSITDLSDIQYLLNHCIY